MSVIGNFGKAVLNALNSVIETSARGGVSVAVTLQDQTTDMLDLVFLELKVTGLTLAVDGVINQRTFTLTGGHGLTNANSQGHVVEVANTVLGRFVQATILDITGDLVTIDQPLSESFATATTDVQTGNPNMCNDAATGVAIDGSTTPVIFTVKPGPIQAGDITRILMATKSSNASDLTTFGGAPALTVGMTLRKLRADGTFKNLYNYKDNFDVALHGFDTKQYDPKGGNSINGFGGRITFAGQSKHGVAERLDGTLGEELQIVISELMDGTGTGNTSVVFIAEGSELQGN